MSMVLEEVILPSILIYSRGQIRLYEFNIIVSFVICDLFFFASRKHYHYIHSNNYIFFMTRSI